MKPPVLFAPLRHADLRRLWIGMGLSYAGDRLQDLAQAWLVATLTGSALAVGAIGILAAIPQLFILVGGAIGDRVDRRRLLIIAQLAGAGLALVVALLVNNGWIRVWHIYLWALASGVVWMFSRPAFKVMLTESVPVDEVRAATSLNSMTESSILVLSNLGGSLLLAWVGLPVAFLLNALSYLAAGCSVRKVTGQEHPAPATTPGFSPAAILADLRHGLAYLGGQPRLLYPMLLTFVTVALAGPAYSLLAAIVHQQGGSIVGLGVLAAAGSLGTVAGATVAGMRAESDNPTRQYALFALFAAVALGLFALLPIGYITPVALSVIGFVMFYEAVGNTSRIRLVAERAYQARLQALATMVFWIGSALGQLWGGAVVDRWGVSALAIGALLLFALGVGMLVAPARPTSWDSL